MSYTKDPERARENVEAMTAGLAAIATLRAQVATLTKERDEAQDQLRVSDELRAAQDSTVALNVERDTTEQIAAWIERTHNLPRHHPIVSEIRSGVWREP